MKNKLKELVKIIPEQTEILRDISNKTLLILPTGAGKTIIAMRHIASLAEPRVLFLTPTNALVMQHHKTFEKMSKMTVNTIFAGGVCHDITCQITFMTAHLTASKIKKAPGYLKKYNFIVFDEVHRATGAYPYVKILEVWDGDYLALTATPAKNISKFKKLLKNLKNPKIINRVTAKRATYDIAACWLKHDPLVRSKIEYLGSKLSSIVDFSKDLGIVKVLKLLRNPNTPYVIKYRCMVYIRLRHLVNLYATQDFTLANEYLKKIKNHRAYPGILKLLGGPPELTPYKNLKLEKISRILSKHDGRAIIMCNYRKMGKIVANFCKQKHNCYELYGKSRGITIKQQKKVISGFRQDPKGVMIMTSAGEEGLDIPTTNLLITYEPLAHMMRVIQRMGRVGRSGSGRVINLAYKDTIQEKLMAHMTKYRPKFIEKISKFK